MRKFSFHGLAFALLLLSSSSITRAEKQESISQAEIAAMVAQLGHETYASREVAFQRLLQIGSAAKSQLEITQSGQNTEVRLRAARLMILILNREAKARALAYETQLADFVADVGGSRKRSLPAWDQFRKIVGDNPHSRMFFVGMQRDQPKLLATYEKDPTKTPQIMEQLLGLPNQGDRYAPPSDYALAAILLAAGDDKANVPEAVSLKLLEKRDWNSQDATDAALLDKLLLRWLNRDLDDTEMVTFYKLHLMVQKKHFQRPMEVLLEKKQLPWTGRLFNLSMIFSTTDANHLEPFLESQLNNSRDMDQIQVRDLALATLIQLTGQKLSDFDFSEEAATKGHMPILFQNGVLFVDDKHRQEGLAKWRRWSEAERPRREQLKAFAADLDGSKKLSLPGWERFREFAGDSPQSRALFADMHRFEPQLLEAYENNPNSKELMKLFESGSSKYDLQVGSKAACAWVGGDPRIPLTLESITRLSALAENWNWNGRATSYDVPLTRIKDRWEQRTFAIRTKLEAFASTRQMGTKLPAWDQYRQVAGNNSESRAFFVEMQRAESELLKAYQRNPSEAARVISKRLQDRLKYTGASLASIVLVAGDEKVKLTEEALLALCSIILPEQPGRPLSGPPSLKLLQNWVNRPTEPAMTEVVYYKSDIAAHYRLKACIEPLVRVAVNHEAPTKRRATALLGFAILGNTRIVEPLEPLLDEDAENLPEKAQLRDLVLAALVASTGQLLKDYHIHPGFDPEPLLDTPNPSFVSVHCSDRVQAIARWHSWLKADRIGRARVQAFAADADGTKEHSLPGWKRFQEVAGTDRDMRALFVEMQFAERELLELYEKSPQDAGKLLEDRCLRQSMLVERKGWARQRTQYHEYEGASLGSLAALLLVAGDEKVDFSEKVHFADKPAALLLSMLQQPDTVTDENRPRLTKLISTWIDRMNTNSSARQECLKLAGHYGLQDRAFDLARTLLETPLVEDTQALQQRAALLSVIAKLGNQSFVKLIEPILEDDTALLPADKSSVELQLRDVALAAAVRLSGQNWNQYKLKNITFELNDERLFQWSSAYFDESEDRDWALAKWRASSKTTANPNVETN